MRMRKLSRVPICERCCVAMTLRRCAAQEGSSFARSARTETNRSNISPAAAREKVSATISCGSSPPFTSAISRSASACVLPVPADAAISTFAFIQIVLEIRPSRPIVYQKAHFRAAGLGCRSVCCSAGCLPACGHGRGNRAPCAGRAICASFAPLGVYIYAVGSESCTTRLPLLRSARLRPRP